jgi:hypothetical protein
VKECPARVSQCAENYLKTNFTFTRVSQHNYAIYQPFISSAGVTNKIKNLTQFSCRGHVAYVARFFQVISMAVNEARRLHTTWLRHTAFENPLVGFGF